MADLYHNIEQNRRVMYADDVADDIVASGFAAGFEGRVWVSARPLGDGCGLFTGVVVHAGQQDLECYREHSDGIELELGVAVYALPAEVVNSFPRERYYPQEGELVEESSYYGNQREHPSE